MTDEELEQLRRSLIMAPSEGSATALTNAEAERIIAELQAARKAIRSHHQGHPNE